MKKLIILLICLTFTGCASLSMEAYLLNTCETWCKRPQSKPINLDSSTNDVSLKYNCECE